MATTMMTRKKFARPSLPMPKIPSNGHLSKLSSADQDLLDRLLGESMDYTDHPDFAKPDIEQTLFPEGTSSSEDHPISSGVEFKRATGSAMPTFTYAQEARMFMRYNFARRKVVEIRKEFSDQRLPGAALKLLLLWGRRVYSARATIVRLNFPLVMAMAKRTRLNSIDFNEMLSEGNLALLRSVEKFDCARGFKFSTYSCRAILKSFSRVAMRASRYRGQFHTEFDPLMERSDFIDQQRDGEEQNCVDELKHILIRNLAGLSEIERRVISERFAVGEPICGLLSKPKTLEQVGSLIGVTKERVRQIQNKALKKIRTALEVRYLAA